MGTPGFGIPTLKILLKNNYDVSAVVTVPDKSKGRGHITSYSDVKKFALEKNLNILQQENLKDTEFINTISLLNPDLIIVVAFRILPKDIFTIPKFGSINLHASLLPKYRGAAPINWAVINGEKETGVTTFFLKEKVDAGNIILQKKIAIEDNDDAGSLQDKLSVLGSETVLETVKLIKEGNIVPQQQDESLASPAPKIFKEDCLINWDQQAEKIHNFIRGLSPYPTAFTYLGNKIVKIFKTNLTDISKKQTQGKILIEDKKLFVIAKDYLLEVLELQTEGKKRVAALDFINGVDKNKDLTFGNKKILF